MVSTDDALTAPVPASQLDFEENDGFQIISSKERPVETPDETNHRELIETLRKLVKEMKVSNERLERAFCGKAIVLQKGFAHRRVIPSASSHRGVVGWISITDCLVGAGRTFVINLFLKNEKRATEVELGASRTSVEKAEIQILDLKKKI